MNSRKTILLAVTALPLLAIGGIAYLGSFTRMHADDFCIASSMNSMGFASSVSFWYAHWAGRFMYLVFSLLMSLTGPSGAAIFPVVLLALLFLFLAWALAPILRKANWPHPAILTLASAGTILLVLLTTAPNLFQSVFWRDGQINYSFPLLGLTLLAGIVVRAWLEPAWPAAVSIGLGLILAFISGGFAEIFDATQAALLALALVISLVLSDRKTRARLSPLLGAALLGAVVALILVVTAPGNQIRQEATGQTSNLARVIPLALRGGAIFMRDFLVQNRWWALGAVLVPFLAGWWLDPAPAALRSRIGWRGLWAQAWFRGLILLPLSALLLAVAACAPSAYALNSYPDERSIFIPRAVLVTAMVISGALLAVGLRRLNWLPHPALHLTLGRALPLVILMAALLAGGSSLWSTFQQAPEFQSYAQSWDKRDGILLAGRQQGLTEITVVGLHARFGIGDLRVEPDYWINGCMAGYYGYSAIRGR
jgi:hypothetical protein